MTCTVILKMTILGNTGPWIVSGFTSRSDARAFARYSRNVDVSQPDAQRWLEMITPLYSRTIRWDRELHFLFVLFCATTPMNTLMQQERDPMLPTSWGNLSVKWIGGGPLVQQPLMIEPWVDSSIMRRNILDCTPLLPELVDMIVQLAGPVAWVFSHTVSGRMLGVVPHILNRKCHYSSVAQH